MSYSNRTTFHFFILTPNKFTFPLWILFLIYGEYEKSNWKTVCKYLYSYMFLDDIYYSVMYWLFSVVVGVFICACFYLRMDSRYCIYKFSRQIWEVYIPSSYYFIVVVSYSIHLIFDKFTEVKSNYQNYESSSYCLFCQKVKKYTQLMYWFHYALIWIL